MRKNLLLLLSVFIGLSLSAQIYEQNFDGFTSGDFLAVVDADNWTTWNNDPGSAEDAVISNAFSETAPNSVLVAGSTDAIYSFGDLTSGSYNISFDMYVPAGKAGYFNLEHIFASEWGLEVYYHADGTSKISGGGQEITDITFTPDTWFNVSIDVNLNDDLCTMYMDDADVITFQWSLKTDGTDGTNQLGVADMFAGAENGDTPEYYFDNFVFEEAVDVIYDEDFDDFTSGDYLAVVDPDNWTTWNNAPGTDEDALISNAFSETAPNSVLVTGSTDAIFSFGDVTSGSYNINFDMYIPAGKAGYFNLEHVFASEWGLEVYYHADGTSKISGGGQEITDVTFTPDTWFNVYIEVNLNDDVCVMYMDDVDVITFQWSLKTDGTEGTNQLSVADMFAGAENGDSPEYYFDNFAFASLSSALTPPTVELNIEEINVAIADGIAVTEQFNIANIGEQNLAYYAYPTFDVPAASGSGTGTMSYCGDFDAAIGSDAATVRKIAVLFQPSMVSDYVGTELTSIEFYMADNGLDFQVKVWGPGETTTPGPGEELLSMDFTPTAGQWNTAELAEGILLDGNPIWIGVEYFQPAGIFAFGSDSGPAVPGVNFSSTGPGWSELSLDRNWNLKGHVTGDPYNTFLDVPVDMGMVAPGNNENVTVFIDPTGLTGGQYTGAIVVATNDPVTNYVNIDVTLDIVTSVNDIDAQDAVMVYPNPTTDMLFLKANSMIKEVKISNYLGQLVESFNFIGENANISISDYENGVYFVEITTVNGKHTIKIIKE